MKNFFLLIALTATFSLMATAALEGSGPSALRVLASVALALILLAIALVVLQNRIVFPRTRMPAKSWAPPGNGIEECVFRTGDGLTLHGWWHAGYGRPAGREPSARGDAVERPVVLWCHGNAGNITHREDNLLLLAHHGLAVFIFDYRGYGRSEGRPSEQGLYLDAQAAYAYLTGERGVQPRRIIAFGRSLGAAVALDLALRQPVAGLIMESAFEGIPAMAKRQFPFLPVRWIARCRFDNLGRVGGLEVPLLMFHGERDTLVPVAQGRRVFASAPEPKRFVLIPGARHMDTYSVGGEDYFGAFRGFCYCCVEASGPAAV
jgi:hypothetical protein